MAVMTIIADLGNTNSCIEFYQTLSIPSLQRVKKGLTSWE